MIVQALLVVSFASVALGKGCCTPDQWEGGESVIGGFARFLSRPKMVGEVFNVSYDAVNQAIASSGFMAVREGSNEMIKFKVIYNFTEKTGYFIDFGKSKCKTFPLRMKFKRACIPGNATELPPTYIGAGDARLSINAYAMKYQNQMVDLHAFVTVTSDGCIPVGETVFGMATTKKWIFKRKTYFYDQVGFAGITEGIKDPSVFDPPDFCKSGYIETMENLDEEFHHDYKVFHF